MQIRGRSLSFMQGKKWGGGGGGGGATYIYEPILKNQLRYLSETHKELKRVTRVHSVRIFSFAKYHIWQYKEFVRMIDTRNDTRNKIFGFAISHLNFDQNAVNYSQKLKKFITVSNEVLQTTE